MKAWLERVVEHGARAARSSIFPVHQALFDALLPDEMRESEPAELAAASERIWVSVTSSPLAQCSLWLLGHLGWLLDPRMLKLYARITVDAPDDNAGPREGSEVIRKFLARCQATGSARSLADLSVPDRRELLGLLTSSGLELHRRVGLGVRMLYYVRLFEGRTGRAIASVSEPSEPQWSPEPGIVVPRYETHLRYDDKRRELIGDLDYIVVGSGCGGSVVAHELQKAGKRVLVIEAGSFFVPGTYDARAGLDFYEARGLRTTADGGIFVLNGEAVGGGGTINVDMAFPPTLPIIAARVERWRALGLIPDDLWTPEELQRAADWTARQFGTRHVRADEINAHNRLLLEGGRARGLAPERYHLNTYAPGESPLRRSDKRGPVDALLMPAMSAAERPVTLLPDARVLRVLMESGVAVGVELETHAPHDKPGVVADPSGLRIPRGTKLSVRARQVVLAAGNLGSSALLLRSRIGHPEIGRGFVMHPFLLLIGEFKQRIDGHSGLSSSIYASDFITTDFSRKAPDFLLEVAAARPEVCAAMCPGPASQVHRMVQRYRSLGGIGVVLLDEPSPHNRVGIDARGKARVFYRLSESDKQRLRNGIVESGKILFEAGAERILMPSFEAKAAADGYQGIVEHPEQLTTMTDELEFRTNQTPLFGAHMMSGNKLAVAPELGVVTPEYEVRGARGLYLVDASIFPSSIGANPMQSIYGVAKIFCDRHLARS